MNKLQTMLALGLSALIQSAVADVTIGVTVSATGPAASLGIPEKNSIALLPKTIGGQKINYIVLDDSSDPTTAVTNARRFVSEDKVDLIIGSSTTPNSLAMVDIAAEAKTPMISLAASARIVEPMDEKHKWIFKTPQNDIQMANAIVAHMLKKGYQNVGFIGFADAYGDSWWSEFSKLAEARKLKIVANERYARSDLSVTGQVLKLMAAKPDAILIAGSGTPAALPEKALKERGFKGALYQTHGVANNDFMRICGADCEGTLLPAGPMTVASQLPKTNPVRTSALEYVATYEAAYGKGSAAAFGGYAWDAGLIVARALPLALKKAQPGSKEFRAALRDAIEATKELPAAHGVFNMTANDHLGLDQRSNVMISISNGAWKLVD